MAAWLPNRHATVARPRTVGPSSTSTKTRRPPSMEPEVGTNPSGRGPLDAIDGPALAPRAPSAPTAPIVAISAPARRTPRQNSRPRSVVVTMSRSCRLIMLLISHLPRRVASPPRVWRDRLPLHEEGVHGQDRAFAHCHAVMNKGANPDRAASPHLGSAGLERAILLRLALD